MGMNSGIWRPSSNHNVPWGSPPGVIESNVIVALCLEPLTLKPCTSRMAHTSRPDKTRSLPYEHLKLRHENFASHPLLKLLS
jgi:hypothetical protein